MDTNVEVEGQNIETAQDSKKKKLFRIRPAWLTYGSIILVVAVAIPTILYLTVFVDNPDFESAMWTCALKASYRVPCMKGVPKVDENYCTRMGCCWNDTDKVCFHSVPSQHSYSISNWVDDNKAREELVSKGLELKSRREASPYGKPVVNQLRALAVPGPETQLRLLFYDPSSNETTLPATEDLSQTYFDVRIYGPDYFSMEISRRENASLLFSTSRGPLIASNNYWELTLQFASDNKVFGLGELELTSKPKVLYNNNERIGSHPFIMVLDRNGNAHGVLFKNSGPMEFELLAESNLLIVRSLSTAFWDLYVFAGPTPKDVMGQFTMDRKPILPPKWALGLHICRETEHNVTQAYVDELFKTNWTFPFDSDCLQESLLGNLNFTTSQLAMDALKTLTDAGKKLLVSLQPQVDSSLISEPEEQFFVVNESGALVMNDYQDKIVSFPDFFSNGTEEWFWNKLKGLFDQNLLGGYVLQEDWPAVNSTEEYLKDTMDYIPNEPLSEGTLWSLMQHYLHHNEYGLRFASSLKVPEDQIVLSTSTYTGTGAVGGSHAHAQTQVSCTWGNMETALKVALGLGLSGVPLAGGGPVCGNVGEYQHDEELCLRWYLMSSMLPLMRVSSTEPLRDPTNMDAFKTAVVGAIEQRYTLISYFYSLFLEASSTGVPVARPFFIEFPADNYTWDRYDHFMVGPALLIRPMFLPNQGTLQVYLPNENIPWYHLLGGHKINNNNTGGYEIGVISMPTELVVLLRGGYIVPLQEQVGTNVAETLSSPYTLHVGLNCIDNGGCNAVGHLNTDENTLNFICNETQLVIQSSGVQTNPKLVLDKLLVYGLDVTAASNVAVSPQDCGGDQISAIVEVQDSVLRIQNVTVDMSCSSVTISWALN